MTAAAPTGTAARRSALDRTTALRLAATEYRLFARTLSGLAAGEGLLTVEVPF